MRWFKRVIGGARALVQRRRVERELDEELREFLETAIDEKMRGGMSREQATRAARLDLGLVSVDSVKDGVHGVGWESVVEGVIRDVSYAVRTFRKSPGFATVAYDVRQRTQEIGIRMALGAQRRTVIGGVLGQVAWIVILGSGVGLGVGLLIPAGIETLLFGIAPRDTWTLGMAATVLAAVALAAAFAPVRRAARVDPVVALRAE